MKKILLVLFLFPMIATGQGFTLQPGAVLTYQVGFGENASELTVSIKQLQPEIYFTYEGSGETPIKGTVTITSEALENSGRLVKMEGNEELLLTDASMLFVTNDIMERMRSGAVNVYFESEEDAIRLDQVMPTKHKLVVNGETVSIEAKQATQVIWNEEIGEMDYGSSITFLEGEFPLILYWRHKGSLKLISAENVVKWGE